MLIEGITHRHFEPDTDLATPEAQASAVADDVVEYLALLFADRISFHGYGTGGGSQPRGRQRRSLWSRLFLGWRTFVWSGPLDERADRTPPD